MTTLQANRRAFDIVVWILAALVIIVIVTSCSPYAPTPEATPSPTPEYPGETTTPAGSLTPSPLPYWMLAARTLRRHIDPANYSGRITYQEN